jgi:hypothetical protein
MNFPIKRGVDAGVRLSMLLWGSAGSGKTTWAATAPGDKLWLSFGEGEHASVSHRQDVFVMDRELFERKNIKTVVVDNLTAIQYLALQKSVADGIGAGKGFTPTMQSPGRGAYGGRNQNLIGLMKSLLAVTGKHRVNIIFTAHENDPVTRVDNKGVETVDYISMSLGGQLVNNVSAQLSEIWNFRQEPGGKRNRIVTIRVSGLRKPLKTRMFSQKGESSFIVNYDPDRPMNSLGQMTIVGFWEQWMKGSMQRIAVPSTRKGGDDADNVVVRLGQSSAV